MTREIKTPRSADVANMCGKYFCLRQWGENQKKIKSSSSQKFENWPGSRLCVFPEISPFKMFFEVLAINNRKQKINCNNWFYLRFITMQGSKTPFSLFYCSQRKMELKWTTQWATTGYMLLYNTYLHLFFKSQILTETDFTPEIKENDKGKPISTSIYIWETHSSCCWFSDIVIYMESCHWNKKYGGFLIVDKAKCMFTKEQPIGTTPPPSYIFGVLFVSIRKGGKSLNIILWTKVGLTWRQMDFVCFP